jgi:acyl dehydratase
MALDQQLVGRSYPPSAVYEVGRAKIAEFATAIGADDRAHHDVEAARALGYPDVIAPPTFAIVLTLAAANVVLDDPQVSLDYSRVVHGEQRFTHHRPVRAGDRLVATTTIDAVRSVAGNDLLTTRVDVATEDGEAVCTATSMLVARGAA